MHRFILSLNSIVVLTLCIHSVSADSYRVADAEELTNTLKRAMPGDEVLLASGDWKDVELRIEGQGTPEQPIMVRAAEPGKTILTGASRIRLSGRHVIVSGLKLHNLSGQKADWLEFRYDSKKRAEDCCVRDCWLIEDESFEAVEPENRWIGLYGRGNRLENCRIEGKKNRGTTVVVWLGEKDLGRHRIAENFFGRRPRLGKNGGETLRIGDSDSSLQSAKCLIESNLFDHCDGETECISNKSCDNVYRNNTFIEVQGTLTLRHGHRCLVEKNVFLGNKRSQTGGIRLIGEGHRIIGNYLADLEGDGFRSAITLVEGVPDAPLNGYQPVRDALIEGNVIVNCKHSVLLNYNDEKKAVIAPTGIVFRNQRIVARPGRVAIEFDAIDKPLTSTPPGFQFEGNLIRSDQSGGDSIEGLKYVEKLETTAIKPLSANAVGPTWHR